MKNIKAFGLLFLAMLLGLAAAVYAANWAAQKSVVASNKVVVAAVDIELGSRVTPQMLSTIDWPSGSMPSGAFRDIKGLQDRVVKVGVQSGEALLEGKLAPPGSQGGLSAVIAEGKRAMTVRVNDVVGVAGFALPGNYVDVMVNAQQDKGKATVATAGMTKTQLFGESPEAVKPVAMIKPVVFRAARPTPASLPPPICVEVIQNGGRVVNCF